MLAVKWDVIPYGFVIDVRGLGNKVMGMADVFAEARRKLILCGLKEVKVQQGFPFLGGVLFVLEVGVTLVLCFCASAIGSWLAY